MRKPQAKTEKNVSVFWKKHGNCWLLGVMWQHLVLLLLLAAGKWEILGKCQKIQ